MRVKSLRQKLLEKLHREHGVFLDPLDMVSFRRNGFGSRIVSWGTIHSKPAYQSFFTMAECLKYPTKLVHGDFGRDREITIEIDFEKIAASNKACTRPCPRCGAYGGHYLGCITYDAMHRKSGG